MSSVHRKLLAAGLATAVLLALCLGEALGAVSVARVLLGLSVLLGLGYVFWKRRGRGRLLAPSTVPRLELVARFGLSSKCGVALVEVDGSPYLITFGDSFAQVQPTESLPQPLMPLCRSAGLVQ